MSATQNRKVAQILPAPAPHWVGDGFPVRSMFSAHGQDPALISPFLLLDYAGPHRFEPDPSGRARGVDEHPHRGFETVTIVYQGELEHRDSAGNSGHIGAGDVQWMTAASGVVHEEKHSEAFTKKGGTLEMVQLWVNLPASEKMSPPRYQELLSTSIPQVALPGDAGTVRVIAGTLDQTQGPAKTVTPINLWDVELSPDAEAQLSVPDGHNLLLMLVRGTAQIGDTPIQTHQGVVLERRGDTVHLRAGEQGASLLLLGGELIDEPVVAHGPFVMNSSDEIRQAMRDYQAGAMGKLSL